MTKTAILFAGQGAQKTGMGKSLYEGNTAAKAIFDKAENVMPGLRELCFSGEQSELNKTVNTQPAVYTVDCAAFAALMTKDIAFDCAAGFSLGEYAALYGAGVLSFEEGLELVIARAHWMQEAAEKTGGGMAAVLGKTAAEVEEAVLAVKNGGVLQAVNYNCPGQTVVAGDEANMAAFLAYCKENRIKAMKLAVNGAFHSEAMKDVSGRILERITNMDMKEPRVTLYSNVLGAPYDLSSFKRILARQTSEPVYFEKIVRDMIRNGVERFIEVGAGTTLTGLVKRTDKSVQTVNINEASSLEEL